MPKIQAVVPLLVALLASPLAAKDIDGPVDTLGPYRLGASFEKIGRLPGFKEVPPPSSYVEERKEGAIDGDLLGVKAIQRFVFQAGKLCEVEIGFPGLDHETVKRMVARVHGDPGPKNEHGSYVWKGKVGTIETSHGRPICYANLYDPRIVWTEGVPRPKPQPQPQADGKEICAAILAGDARRIKELLAANPALADAMGPDGALPLHLAASTSQKEIAVLLIDAGAKLNERDRMSVAPLHLASLHSSGKEIVALLLARGADPDVRSGHGATPLFGAGSAEIASLLIARGADVRATNNDEATPLHRAVTKEVAEVLIAAGAPLEAKARTGWTPLHWAASEGRAGVASALLAKGANAGARAKDGSAPLHWAASSGRNDLAEMLLAAGADVNAASDDGRTPLDWAVRTKKTAMVVFLRERGGKQTR